MLDVTFLFIIYNACFHDYRSWFEGVNFVGEIHVGTLARSFVLISEDHWFTKMFRGRGPQNYVMH